VPAQKTKPDPRGICEDMLLCLLWGIMFATLIAFEGSSKAAQEALPSAPVLQNIALGKAYTLDPQPNYPYCTDPDDRMQLTDGRYTSGHFWTQKSTVGWTGKYATITIDLGAVHAIKGVSYNTAAGVAGVRWPSGIYILVSDDGKHFYEVGELIAMSRKGNPKLNGAYQIHRYRTDALCTHGRYL